MHTESCRKSPRLRELPRLLVSQQVLECRIRTHPKRILERQMRREGHQTFPQRCHALLTSNLHTHTHTHSERGRGVLRQSETSSLTRLFNGWLSLRAQIDTHSFKTDVRNAYSFDTCFPQSIIPEYFFAVSSCNLVLITSMGCRKLASTSPPMEPATPFT